MILIFCQLAKNGSCSRRVKRYPENYCDIIFKCNCRSYISSCLPSYWHHKSKNPSTILPLRVSLNFCIKIQTNSIKIDNALSSMFSKTGKNTKFLKKFENNSPRYLFERRNSRILCWYWNSDCKILSKNSHW